MTSTVQARSEARTVAELLIAADSPHGVYIGAPAAPSTISHSDYGVSYYADQSILIVARGETPIVLDENRTYYRDTVEHLARCLGIFSQERRAEMLAKHDAFPVWVDGIAWNQDGSFAGI